MYERQVTLYIDPQIEKKQGFLRALPLFWLEGVSFTYHVHRWRLEYARKGGWFEHEFLHCDKLESSSNHLVVLVRRKWLRSSNEFMDLLVQNWLNNHPERHLTVVTDEVEGLKLSKFHTHSLTDLTSPIYWPKRYEDWLKRLAHKVTWKFRSLSILLGAFALLETERGRYVDGLDALIAPGSLMVDSLLRRMSAGPLRQEEFPLHGITQKMVRQYVTPYLDHPQDIEEVVEGVLRRAENATWDTIPPLSHVGLSDSRSTKWEQDLKKLVMQCVI